MKKIRFNQLLDYPIGTKFRLPWWSEGDYIYFLKNSEGQVYLERIDHYAYEYEGDFMLTIQDEYVITN